MKKIFILIFLSLILLVSTFFLYEYSPKCLSSNLVISKLDNWDFQKNKDPIPDEIMQQSYPVHSQTGEKLYCKWKDCYITEKQREKDEFFEDIANFLIVTIYILWSISGIILIYTLFKNRNKIKGLSKKIYTKEFLIKIVLTLLSIYLIILIFEKIFGL